MLFSLADQVSLAGSAIATLHKELSSPSTPRKIIKPVKSPSPSRQAAVEVHVIPEPFPPPFRDVRYKTQLDSRGAYAFSEEEFEEWEPQVGLMSSLLSFLSFLNLILCGCSSEFFYLS